MWFVYYESIKQELKIRGIYECRCAERLQTKTKKFTRLPYTGLVLIRKAAALARTFPILDLSIEEKLLTKQKFVVYYESIKRMLKIRCIGVSV